MGSKTQNALTAVFSSATLNGAAAVSMSLAMGSVPATALYAYAVLAGAYNKYRTLNQLENPQADPDRQGALSRIFTDPSITARILMLAAAYNFGDAGMDVLTGPEEGQASGLIRMLGWTFGFFGDNALRRLDSVNFSRDRVLGKPRSRLHETFNALTANPTLFYSGASSAFTMAAIARGGGSGFSSLEGLVGLASLGLVASGVGYAVRRTWKANKGEIASSEINDGVMNYLSSSAKAMQCAVALMTGNYWLAMAQAIFTGTNIKVIYETRAALSRKAERPPASV